MVASSVFVLAGGTACEGQDGRAAGGPDDVEAYTLADAPSLALGGRDERSEYQLQYTVGAARLSDERIVIADAGSRDLRYYDARGQHLQTVGGRGEGPGEFRNIRSIARIVGDTIVAWDPASRRISFFASDGQFALAVPLTGWQAVLEELQAQDPGRTVALYDMHVPETGELVMEPFSGRVPDAMEETRVIQDTIPLFVFDRGGEQTGSLGPFPTAESFLRNRAGGLLRFGERLTVAAGGDLVYVGSTRDPVIRGFSPGGDVARSITLPIEPRPLAPDDVPDPGQGPVAEFVEAMPLPDSMPLFSGIHHGVDGRLWVQRYRAPRDRSQEWMAFDEAGALVASLTMDASLDLLDIGRDYAVVLATDELDVQEIRVHPLSER